MRNRNMRDAERRNYIRERTKENLGKVLNDPQSLFIADPPEEDISKINN